MFVVHLENVKKCHGDVTPRVDRRFGPIQKRGALQWEKKLNPWITPTFVERSTDQIFVQQAPIRMFLGPQQSPCQTGP